MTVVYSEEQIIAEVPGLDRTLLVRFIEARIVIPVERAGTAGLGFLPVEAARLRLACDLCESFELEDDALGVIMTLVDRMHVLRADLRAVLEAVESLPDDHREHVRQHLTGLRAR